MKCTGRSQTAERAAPRLRVLLGLGAGVLLAHLSLLSGGLSGLSLDMFVASLTEPSADRTAAAPAPSATTPEQLPAPEAPQQARTSRVRWIVPKPPEPVAAPAPPPPSPRPPPKPELEVLEPPPEPEASATAGLSPEPPPVAPSVDVPVEPSPVPADPGSQPPTSAATTGTVEAAGAGLSDAGLPPATPAPSTSLSYATSAQSKGSNYSGSSKLEWKHDGQQYEASLTTRVLVFTLLEQTSAGRITDRGLVPDRFTDRRRSNERAAHFDREGQRLRYSNNSPDGKLLPGTQDRLSINFQLSGLFNARPDAYAEGQVLRVPVTSIDMAEVWLFEVGPLTTETLPAGDLPARKLTRSPRREYDRKVEVWLLPGYAHLPGRLRITEPNGDYLDMRLDELPVLEKPTADVP